MNNEKIFPALKGFRICKCFRIVPGTALLDICRFHGALEKENLVPLKSTAIANDFGQSFCFYLFIYFFTFSGARLLCANEYTCILFKFRREGSCLASSNVSNSFLSKDFKIYILVEYFWYLTPFANQVSCSRLRYWLL